MNARWALERATVLGPESAGLRWARAYLLAIGPEPDWEECFREWVRGCWLHHEATRPLARTDEVVERPVERGYRAVVVPEGRLPDTLRFRPCNPVVFAGALGRIPPLTAVAGLTANLLREAARREPAAAATAAEVAVIWLEAMRHRFGTVLGSSVVERSARGLLGPEDPPGWRGTIEDYLGQDGPLRRAEREEAAAEAAAAADQRASREEIRRRLDALAAVPADAEQGDRGEQIDNPDEQIDWDAWLARAEEDLREHVRWGREHEEELVEAQEREAEREAFSRDLDAMLARLNRMRTGRATEADLDDAQSGVDLPEAPWPEPRPRPGERTGEPTG